MEKTFTVAGTSNLYGVVKFRFANDIKSRRKVLERNGHTDIQLMELPTEMTKQAAREWLAANTDWELPTVDKQDNAEAEDNTEEQEQVDVEAQIEQLVAEMCANGRPRNARGHFIKMEELREQARAQLNN